MATAAALTHACCMLPPLLPAAAPGQTVLERSLALAGQPAAGAAPRARHASARLALHPKGRNGLAVQARQQLGSGPACAPGRRPPHPRAPHPQLLRLPAAAAAPLPRCGPAPAPPPAAWSRLGRASCAFAARAGSRHTGPPATRARHSVATPLQPPPAARGGIGAPAAPRRRGGLRLGRRGGQPRLVHERGPAGAEFGEYVGLERAAAACGAVRRTYGRVSLCVRVRCTDASTQEHAGLERAAAACGAQRTRACLWACVCMRARARVRVRCTGASTLEHVRATIATTAAAAAAVHSNPHGGHPHAAQRARRGPHAPGMLPCECWLLQALRRQSGEVWALIRY